MLHKLATYGICFILVLTASCGIFDPSSSMGTLNIIVEKSDVNTQLNKTMGVLSTAQCIIKRYDSVKYASTIPKTDDCFHSEITSLQAGRHYSVFLYGKYDLSHNIAVSAHQSDILIVKGKKRKVVLSWAEFMTSLSKPELNDTLSEHSVNFEWRSVAGANKYRLIVDDNNFFTSPGIDTTLNANQATIDFELLPAGTYFWRIQCIGCWQSEATNNSQLLDREGIWSRISHFEFKKQP